MNEKKRAIVLGGTSPHIELIKKLMDRGYFVILVDYLDNSPGIRFADQHIQESTLDKEAVLSIARSNNASLVISTCIDQANSICCYVAEKLNLPHPYSYQTSLDTTDKGRMKRIMVDNDIPTSSFFTVSSIEDIDWEKITYPAVVKPVDCNSSKGVHKADCREEIISYVKEDILLSRTKTAIIEGFNKGYEIQVDCFAEDNSAKVLMTRQKKKIETIDNSCFLQSTGSIVPAILTDELNVQASEIAQKIAKAFGLKNTPFFYQAIVTHTGISVLELAPRIGGGLSYYMIKEFAGVDPVELAINSFLDERSIIETRVIDKKYSTNLLYMKPGIFSSIEGLQELKDKQEIIEYFLMKNPETEIGADLRSGNRVGAFVLEATEYKELSLKESEIYKKIRVLNNKGEDLLNRDINK